MLVLLTASLLSAQQPVRRDPVQPIRHNPDLVLSLHVEMSGSGTTATLDTTLYNDPSDDYAPNGSGTFAWVMASGNYFQMTTDYTNTDGGIYPNVSIDCDNTALSGTHDSGYLMTITDDTCESEDGTQEVTGNLAIPNNKGTRPYAVTSYPECSCYTDVQGRNEEYDGGILFTPTSESSVSTRDYFARARAEHRTVNFRTPFPRVQAPQ